MPVFDWNGVAIAYEDSGPKNSTTLLFIHGWTADRHRWDIIVAQLDPEYRCIRLDLPGHGESALPPEFSIEGIADCVRALGDFLGLEEPVLIGHSMGGMAAMSLALRDASVTRAVVLIDTTDRMVFSPLRAVLVALSLLLPYRFFLDVNIRRAFSREVSPFTVRAFVRQARNNPKSVVMGYYRAMLRFSVADRVGEIKAPVLIAHGYHDIQFPLTVAFRMSTRLQDCVLEVLNSGHESPVEVPRTLAQAIQRLVTNRL